MSGAFCSVQFFNKSKMTFIFLLSTKSFLSPEQRRRFPRSRRQLQVRRCGRLRAAGTCDRMAGPRGHVYGPPAGEENCDLNTQPFGGTSGVLKTTNKMHWETLFVIGICLLDKAYMLNA